MVLVLWSLDQRPISHNSWVQLIVEQVPVGSLDAMTHSLKTPGFTDIMCYCTSWLLGLFYILLQISPFGPLFFFFFFPLMVRTSDKVLVAGSCWCLIMLLFSSSHCFFDLLLWAAFFLTRYSAWAYFNSVSSWVTTFVFKLLSDHAVALSGCLRGLAWKYEILFNLKAWEKYVWRKWDKIGVAPAFLHIVSSLSFSYVDKTTGIGKQTHWALPHSRCKRQSPELYFIAVPLTNM